MRGNPFGIGKDGKMEFREVYRRDGTATGEIVEKHAPRRPGDYFRHVVLILKTQDSPPPGQGEGQYIVQQRSLKARYFAGKWDVTGGGVQAGETPAQAAVREAEEELHLHVSPDDLRLVYEYSVHWDGDRGLFISMFACRAAVPESGFTWDEREVNDVKVMPFRAFRAHVMDHNDEAFGQALDRTEQTL